MKKLFFLLGLFVFYTNVNAAPVVLSDESVDEDLSDVDDEPFVAPQSTNSYQSQSVGYVEEQIKPAAKSILANDTSDPLFFVGDNQFLSDTYTAFKNSTLRIGEYIGYGINNNFAIHMNMQYQIDFTHDHENGFAATEFGGTYRLNHGNNDRRIISDVLFGLKLWGSTHVRTPEYADSSYYAGFRFGRQYTGLTLAGTVKSTWIFDEDRGVSYIDFIPEMYFRFKYDWRGGLGADIRRSTNIHLMPDQEWLNFKLLKQFGNTQYVGRFDYEFELHEVQVGFNLKILF